MTKEQISARRDVLLRAIEVAKVNDPDVVGELRAQLVILSFAEIAVEAAPTNAQGELFK